MTIFVSLTVAPLGHIKLRYDVPNVSAKFRSQSDVFKPTDIDGMAKFIAAVFEINGGETGFTYSSSVYDPGTFGLKKSFKIDDVLEAVVEKVRESRAVRLQPMPVDQIVDAVENVTRGQRFPITLIFEKSGKPKRGVRDDVTLVFADLNQVDQFINGVKCAQRMVEISAEPDDLDKSISRLARKHPGFRKKVSAALGRHRTG